MFKRVPGTKDILPIDIDWWLQAEEIGRKTFSLYNYRQIRPPLIEEASLFDRSLGESAEIVQKQMFLIKNNEDVYALRPEGTASIVRAYIENNLDKSNGFVKLYYIGPMFRLERPQKGRLRQFHHLGCEVIGSYGPQIDVEVITLADTLLKKLDIQGYKIKMNTLGCAADKKNLGDFLRRGLESKLDKLCPDCQMRFQKNILRILDCKNEPCQEIVAGLQINDGHLCQPCKDHFAQVRQGLDSLGIKYEVSPLLVRGLDYYTRTVFEFIHDELGPQQNALGAGGRYDLLLKDLGGPELGAIGFAFGMERLLMIGGCKTAAIKNKLVYMVILGEGARPEGFKILKELRDAGIAADTDYENRSIKGAMRRANDLGAGIVLILGEDEIKKNIITFKDMASGEQKEVQLNKIIEELKCYAHTPAGN